MDGWQMYMIQIMGQCGSDLKLKSQMIWSNVVKTILAEIWFERNQRDHFEVAIPSALIPSFSCRILHSRLMLKLECFYFYFSSLIFMLYFIFWFHCILSISHFSFLQWKDLFPFQNKNNNNNAIERKYWLKES